MNTSVLNRKGNLPATVCAGIFLVSLAGVWSKGLQSHVKSLQITQERKIAHERAANKLQQLLNLPFTNTELSPGTHSLSSPIPYSWTVTQLSPKLLRITLTTPLQHPNTLLYLSQSVGVEGYKYYDF